MGIDIYLKWDGAEEALTGDARWEPDVYIRESYFSKAYASYVFIPETFATYPFSSVPMTREEDWPEGVERLNDGIRYPWSVLAGRIEAVMEKARERADGDGDYAQSHADTFMAFVRKVHELDDLGIKSWVVNSY